MSSRKDIRKVQDDAAHLAAEDPLILETRGILTKWSDRATVSGRTLVQVQHLVGVLATQLDGCNKELMEVYADANLLSALRISDYRRKMNPSPTPPASSKKQKSRKRSCSPKVACKPVDANSTEALITGMDEKKRQKLSAALVSFFKRPSESPLPPPSLSPTSPGVKPTAFQTPTQLNDGTNQHHTTSIVSDAVSTGTAADRRPKDMPVELWDEMTRLRLRRLLLDERIEVLTNDLTAQVKRFDLLVQSHGIALYSRDSVEQILQTMKRSKGVA